MKYAILYSMEQNAFQKIREEEKVLRGAVKERITMAMTGAFGLVAALAWNDAVKASIDYFYPPQQGPGLLPKFIYAIVVTLVVSLAVYLLTKFFATEKK